MKKPQTLAPRKLLVAAVGVATVNYVAIACGGIMDNETSGNLPAPRPFDAATDARDAARPPTSGNLPAPPPVELDASDDASDADTADADDEEDAGDAG